ncbi:TerB family tellurite resistance protein [Pseudahrensia aquimaris]|uniref:TerB family tellurite resistance protein n=1 Tax=Pseudahrensia aquimaris TaxID=744461 RepID=A0ABW3FJP7_9HYPH
MSDYLKFVEVQLKQKPPGAVQLAVATFLFKVMPVDGETHPKELERLKRILSDEFGLEEDNAEKLIEYARNEANSAERLNELASMLKANAGHQELLTLISHMWEMVFADGRMHETEILFVERVAELLDIPEEDVAAAMSL